MSEFVVYKELPALMLINGESKCGKTTVGNAVARWAETHRLRYSNADAGLFFRTITEQVFGLLGIVRPGVVPPLDELEDAAAKVVSDESIFSPTNACRNPEASLIAHNVSTVGKLSVAQDAALVWFERTAAASMADDADIIIINGRDPRQRLQGWLTQNRLRPALDLLVQCDVDEAARRVTCGAGSAALQNQVELIERRRNEDRERKVFPFEGAAGSVVSFELPMYGGSVDWAAEQAALSAWAAEGDRPSTIVMDTTHLSLAGTQEAAAALASYSFETHVARNQSLMSV